MSQAETRTRLPRRRLDDEALESTIRGFYRYLQTEVPKRPVGERALDFVEVCEGYTHEEARAEAERCLQCQDPPCVKGCPAHLNVPGFIKAITDGELERGLQIVMDTYPLPGSCGRVCFHPCMDVCLKGVKGQPLNIPRLRRFLADQVNQKELDYNIPPDTGRRIACIGSGPAGLTAAYLLRRKGHSVVVFERGSKPGGTLNTIPDYRLPDDVLQGEIEVLKWLGVEIRLNSPVEGEGCLDRLLEEYDAVFIGAGAVRSTKLKIPGADLEGTMTALEYLHAVDRGQIHLKGRKVAVVGGGNVALDALRSALRQADEVHLVYRRAAEQMPAAGEEVIELGEEAEAHELHEQEMRAALTWKDDILAQLQGHLEKLTLERRREVARRIEERLRKDVFEKLGGGRVSVHFLTQPLEVLGRGRDGRVAGLRCGRMELGEPDESGRRRPVLVEGDEFEIPVDVVLFAIGQKVDSGWLGEESGLTLSEWGTFQVDEETQQTSRPRVFAGGDAVRGPASMIEAIADGKRAAEAIDRLLCAEATAASGASP